MAIEPIEFFVDIGALQDQHEFLFEAFGIDAGGNLRKALVQFAAQAFADFRHACSHTRH